MGRGGFIHRWVGALCLGPLSSSHGSSASSESSRLYGAARHPEMLRILGLMLASLSTSGSGAGSSGRGKPRRSHGATVWIQNTQTQFRLPLLPNVPEFFPSLEVALRTRSSKVKSGVEQRVSSLDRRRWESLEQGVWGLDVVSGLAGLMGDGTWL